MNQLQDPNIYLSRLAKPLQEKLKIKEFIPRSSRNILDVGCADGVVTQALAKIFPQTNFLGIDLNPDFISLAKNKSTNQKNVSFRNIYLRDLLAKKDKFDTIIFCSVLHEFFSYGEGLTSVVKAISDAYELLNPGGKIIIRDMVLSETAKSDKVAFRSAFAKIKSTLSQDILRGFEKLHGRIENSYQLNHLLLKYWYTENWDREGPENYVPVSEEKYLTLFSLLNLEIEHLSFYTIEFVKNKWISDFNLSVEELSLFRSTGILVSRRS